MPPPDRARAIAALERLAHTMDTAFRIPGTSIRLGWDSILGLIPGIGDVAGLAPLVYYVSVARRFRLGWGVYLKLLANQVIDLLIGLVPLVGDLLDVGFKANVRNAELLIRRLQR